MTAATAPADGAATPAVRAVPLRHPGRWVAVAVLLVVVAMFGNMLLTNPAFQWGFLLRNMVTPPVLVGVRTSLLMTVLAMGLGVALGTLVAVMRLSANPVLSSVAWVYTWFFRAVPRVVLLVLFGNLGILYARFEVGLPFDRQLGALVGLQDFDGRFAGIDARTLLSGFVAGLLALALSEAAYMGEIVRAGIGAVDAGQTEAATALAMTRGQALRLVVLPQAMRVIVPPTGNETIAMLKDTSLLAFVPVNAELFFQLQQVGSRTFQVFPMLVAACLWYLALSSVLLVGQWALERRYGRGVCGAVAWVTCRRSAPRPRLPDGPGRAGPQVLRARRGAARRRPGGARGHGHVRAGAVRVRASRRSCAASTTSSGSTPGASGSTATWSATPSAAAGCTRSARPRPPSSAATSAWSSSGSTCSRT